jgi:hypothetical protein
VPPAADEPLSRREALTTLAVGSVALLEACAAPRLSPEPAPKAPPPPGDSTMTFAPALAGNHTPLALPFAPGSLNGLSERLLISHHENNYGGAVRNLNRVEQELARITSDTPPFVHSYQMDFGAGAAKYIDVFFANVNWDQVNERLDRGRRMSEVRGAAR